MEDSLQFCVAELRRMYGDNKVMGDAAFKDAVGNAVDVEENDDGENATFHVDEDKLLRFCRERGFVIQNLQNRRYINRVYDRAWNIYRGIYTNFETLDIPEEYGIPTYLTNFVNVIKVNFDIEEDDDKILIKPNANNKETNIQAKVFLKEERCRYFFNLDYNEIQNEQYVDLWTHEVCFHRKEGMTCTNGATESSSEVIVSVNNGHEDHQMIPVDYILNLKSAPSTKDLDKFILNAESAESDEDGWKDIVDDATNFELERDFNSGFE